MIRRRRRGGDGRPSWGCLWGHACRGSAPSLSAPLAEQGMLPRSSSDYLSLLSLFWIWISFSFSCHYQHNTTQHNTSSLKALNDVVSYSSTPETTQASGPCWAFILDPSPVSSSVHTCRTTTKKKILVECLAPNRIFFFIDKKNSKPLTKKKAPNRFLILTPKNLYMRMLYYNIIIFDSICQNIS